MCRIILGILFVVMASHPIQATYHNQKEYRDEYTNDKVFIRVLANLTQVPDDIPDEAIEVNLRYNMITDIPINAFSNLLYCKILRLSYNEISEIESGMFNGLNSLIHLDLSFNMITDIPIKAFSNLRHCQTLDLSYNEISVIESGMFNGINSLSYLDLAHNMITNIPINAFSNIPDCKTLSLSQNKISEIESGMFNGLNSLIELNLNVNMITDIPINGFSNLSDCLSLRLLGNQLSVIESGMFNGINSLTELDLGNNMISAISERTFTGFSLDRLTLGSNKITALVSLTHLYLGGNRISTLPANAFSTLSNCNILILAQNPIKNIEARAFHGLVKLTDLDLYGTSVTHLSQNMFQELFSLKYLRLHRSRISKIARGAFAGLDQLQTLYLHQNELTVIESYMFSGLLSLDYLFLNHNNINDIKDSAFLSLGKLTNLYLYNNQLEHLRPNTFAGLGSLEVLDLGDNKLTTLDPLVLLPLKRPLNLAMDAQPSSMVCDMKLCWLKLEEAGSIVWKALYVPFRATGVYYPTCTGGVAWRFLQCPATLPCRDPGDVDFAERSGSFLPFNNNSQPGLGLPYSTDYELKYTCDPCYTGGGTITCQSNGQWTRKPECTRIENKVVCRAAVLVDGYLTPSVDQYECGVKVTFTCNQGSKQTVGVCGPDGHFIGGISSCERNGETVTAFKDNGGETVTGSPGQGMKPESGAAGGSSSGLIYGLVGAAVGGIVVTVLIVLTIYCVIRSKKRNPSEADMIKTRNTAVGDKASEAGYIGLVTVDMKGKPGNSLNRQAEPTADRNTPEQRVTGDGTVYSNTVYENEYQEIEDALPKEDPYEDVDEDAYEN